MLDFLLSLDFVSWVSGISVALMLLAGISAWRTRTTLEAIDRKQKIMEIRVSLGRIRQLNYKELPYNEAEFDKVKAALDVILSRQKERGGEVKTRSVHP